MRLFILIAGLLAAPLFIFGQPEGPLFRFAAIADVQYCDCDSSNTRFYRMSPAKLDTALETLKAEDPAFLVHLGDVIDKYYESYGIVMPYFEGLPFPVHFTLGNHEFSISDSLKWKVPELLGMENRYYDFRVQGWRFIVTDGNEESLYAWPVKSKPYRKSKRLLTRLSRKGVPQAQSWNGGMGEAQLSWLDGVLADAQAKGEQVVLFSHFPIAPGETHNLWNDQELVSLLETYPNVVAWISGHNHNGGYVLQKGIHYLILHGMVDTRDTNAFALISVYTDRLEVKGWGREPSRTLWLK